MGARREQPRPQTEQPLEGPCLETPIGLVGDELGEPPTTVPTAAAAGAVEQALAGTLKALRRQRASAQRPEAIDPLHGISSRALVREVARRQLDRIRRSPR